MPLHHPSGHAQADFGEASVVIDGVEQTAHFFAFDLPQSDACFVRAYPAATAEAWVDGHVHAFAFFGGVPLSVLYDKDRPGGAHPARPDAQAGHAVQRVPVALPDPRPLRPARQGQRLRTSDLEGQTLGGVRLYAKQIGVVLCEEGAEPVRIVPADRVAYARRERRGRVVQRRTAMKMPPSHASAARD